jgi:hypothetical protein
MVDVSDIKGLLRAFDGCMTAPVRNAVGMLRRVTEAIAKQPDKYELLDPGEGFGCGVSAAAAVAAAAHRVSAGQQSPEFTTAWLPADNCEEWRSAGGESFCDNVDFPGKVCSRWRELLGRPGEPPRLYIVSSHACSQQHHHGHRPQASCGIQAAVTHAAK